MTQVNFKPIFPSPLGYVNFGNANKDLNKQLIKDMEQERKEHSDGKSATFKKNNASWQSLSQMEDRWDSFVAAWLPGTEGSGVADVLFGDYNPTGKLSFSWPKNMNQFPINPEDDHLYNFGYGLSY